MTYSFHHCSHDAKLVFIEIHNVGMAEAMRHAVDLAFKEGEKAGSLRGRFICIHDAQGNEVFRTPLAR